MAIRMKPLDLVAYWLVAVGAVNWGLVKVFGFNVVDWLLGIIGISGFAIYVYGIVGLAGVYAIYKAVW